MGSSKFRGMRGRQIGGPLSLVDQLCRMRFAWRGMDSRIYGRKLISRGNVQPTPINGIYRVRIEYAIGDVPKAFVEKPTLQPRSETEPVPHVYLGPRPCLYLPGSGEWTPGKSIARTIVPWLLLWLFYYELWHATGEWRGGGASHQSAKTDAP